MVCNKGDDASTNSAGVVKFPAELSCNTTKDGSYEILVWRKANICSLCAI